MYTLESFLQTGTLTELILSIDDQPDIDISAQIDHTVILKWM